MNKRSLYTVIDPLPATIPRRLAIEILQSHGEVIELNPLVLEHHPVDPPRDAPTDEFYSQWYELTERIQYMPGIGKLGSGKIRFKVVFHDMPWGVQCHAYAPAGVDLRTKWQIRGNEPGEPPEVHELGDNAPKNGLYLKQEVNFKCNIAMVSFVKKELKQASKTMVERLIKKAELIDAELLKSMWHHQPPSPGVNMQFGSPNPANLSPDPSQQPGQGRDTMLQRSKLLQQKQAELRNSMYGNQPTAGGWQGQNPPGSPGFQRTSQYLNPQSAAVPPPNGLAIEMMGDTHHSQVRQLPTQQGRDRQSMSSELSGSNTYDPSRLSGVSQAPQTSSQSEFSWSTSSQGQPEQRLESVEGAQKAFVAELPAEPYR